MLCARSSFQAVSLRSRPGNPVGRKRREVRTAHITCAAASGKSMFYPAPHETISTMTSTRVLRRVVLGIVVNPWCSHTQLSDDSLNVSHCR